MSLLVMFKNVLEDNYIILKSVRVYARGHVSIYAKC